MFLKKVREKVRETAAEPHREIGGGRIGVITTTTPHPNKLLRDSPKEEKGKAAASLREEVEAVPKVKAKANPEDGLIALAKARVKGRIVHPLEFDPRRKAREREYFWPRTMMPNHALSTPEASVTGVINVGIFMTLKMLRRQIPLQPRAAPLSQRRRETSPNQGLQRLLVALQPSS